MKCNLRRGFTIGSVMVIAIIILTVGLALASTSVFNLTTAYEQVSQKQAELATRGAVTEFIHQATRLEGENGDVIAPEAALAGLSPIRTYFERHPLLYSAQDPDVQVKVSFDATQPNYSTDNSKGLTDTAGWKRTVPPFSVYLVLQTHCNRVSRNYGVLLRRSWPYAVTVPRQMDLQGAVADCAVDGNVLMLKDPIEDQAGPARILPEDLAMLLNLEAEYSKTPMLDVLAYELGVNQMVSANTGNVRLAGNRALIKGNIDTDGLTNVPVEVASGAQWTGSQHRQIGRDEIQRQLEQVLKFPDVPAGAANPVVLFPTFFRRNVTSSQPNSLQINRFERTADLIQGQLALTGAQAPYYCLQTSSGNRVVGLVSDDRVVNFPPPNEALAARTTGTLKLSDCVLHVKGNLDLTGTDPNVYTLDGDNATLIVEGTLTLDQAYLNSRSRGMVILCRDLVLRKGHGNFKVLLLVQRQAIVLAERSNAPLTPTPNPGMTIEGGIICGQYENNYILTGQDGAPVMARVVGLNLADMQIKYNPRYLRGLNQLGDYRVVSLNCL